MKASIDGAGLQVEQIETDVRPVELQPLADESQDAGKALFQGNLNLIGDVRVRIRAVVGEGEISISELFSLKDGSLVKLDAEANQPIDIFLDNKRIARGELVVVDDSFGICIKEIIAEHG
jgi:flagellar motor switch protein FliN/FliY